MSVRVSAIVLHLMSVFLTLAVWLARIVSPGQEKVTEKGERIELHEQSREMRSTIQTVIERLCSLLVPSCLFPGCV